MSTKTDDVQTTATEHRRVTLSGAGSVAVAAAAWIATIVWAHGTGNGPGTMGLGFLAFCGMWIVMMTAMMLPALSRTLAPQPLGDAALFTAGYLLVWAAAGVPAFALAVGAGKLVDRHPAIATGGAVVLFGVCGLYQFSPFKTRSLAHCRSQPPGSAAHVGGAVRHGLRHGLWCASCYWAAMVLLVAFGFMNVGAMIVLASVVYAEIAWTRGLQLSRVAGLASFACVVLVLIDPAIAVGLHHAPSMTTMSG
jgi:predicted metal-binding membrane protein